MSSQYTDLVGRGGDPHDTCWKLISQSVQAIFAELHMARISGREPFLPGERPAGIACWGCLQAYNQADERIYQTQVLGGHKDQSYFESAPSR
jgi:hypothetical protein